MYFEDAIGNEGECFSLGIEVFSALGCAMCMDRLELDKGCTPGKGPQVSPLQQNREQGSLKAHKVDVTLLKLPGGTGVGAARP